MALLMAAVMVLPMTECGSRPAETTTADTTATTEATADTNVTDATAVESAAGIAASGKKYVINMDTTFAPFKFEDKKGGMVGTDSDTLRAIAQDRGLEYEVIPVGFSAARIALESGEYNGVIVGMFVTDERIQKHNFSEPYYDSGAGMTVLSGSDITTCDQLKGQNVATKIGTKGYTFVEFIVDQYGFEATQYENSPGICQAVLSGEAAVCFENYPVIGYETPRGPELTLPTDIGKGPSYGFATLKGANPELVDVFNKGLKNIKANGRYEEILNTYIAK